MLTLFLILAYLVIGAWLWSYWDDSNQNLLKEAEGKHELLPLLLMLLWPLFLYMRARRHN